MMQFYGNKFTTMWKAIDLPEMKQLWSEKLSVYSDNPDCLTYALEETEKHDWPPSLSEFLAACRDYIDLDRHRNCAKCDKPTYARIGSDNLCGFHWNEYWKRDKP